jgi:hypothetical protein
MKCPTDGKRCYIHRDLYGLALRCRTNKLIGELGTCEEVFESVNFILSEK